MGEGYHDFHHEFPSHYRNGIEWYQVDFTKWLIAVFECAGLAYELNRFQRNEIKKGRIQQALRKLKMKSQSLDWGRPLSEPPIMEWNEYQDKVRHSQPLVLINGIVHDVSLFLMEHPGGE